jgi:SAM-dependent methyltransferase
MEHVTDAAWAFAAVAACAEYGLIEQLDDATPDALAAQTGLRTDLVTRLLDVLVALGLASRCGSLYTAAPGVAAASATLPPGFFAAVGRAQLLQIRDLAERARRKTLNASGWQHANVELLQAQGTMSGAFAHNFQHVLLPQLTGLGERLAGPDACFLDVGCGVGEISIALCRRFPALRCVGLEPLDAPLAIARQNVGRAGLRARIELRCERVENLADVERFDLVWLPLPFFSPDAVEPALERAWRALRPGGWAMMANVGSGGEDVGSAVSRLRCTLWGGAPLADETLAALLGRIGFTDIRGDAAIPMAPTRARRPPG